MKISDIITKARIIGSFDNSTFADNDILDLLNMDNGSILAELNKISDVQYYNSQCATIHFRKAEGLTKSQIGYQGHYPLNDDFLEFIKAEVKYSKNGDFVEVQPYDLKNSPFRELNNNFSESNPRIRFYDKFLIIHPTPQETVLNGLKIWYKAKLSPLTLNSDFIFDENYHKLFVFKILSYYFYKKEDTQKGDYYNNIAYKIERDLIEDHANRYREDDLQFNTQTEDYT